jgi:hypothetical protein
LRSYLIPAARLYQRRSRADQMVVVNHEHPNGPVSLAAIEHLAALDVSSCILSQEGVVTLAIAQNNHHLDPPNPILLSRLGGRHAVGFEDGHGGCIMAERYNRLIADFRNSVATGTPMGLTFSLT